MPRISGCWANVLDDCDGKLTREHIISVAATPHDSPNASRQQREQCVVRHSSRGGPKGTWTREMTVRNLVSHILCSHHNNGLSEVDTAGGAFCNAIRSFYTLAHERRFSRLHWEMKTFESDGLLLERWLMKTAVNLAVGYRDNRRIGSALVGVNEPTTDLAEMIYGRRPVIEPYGVWFVSRPDHEILFEDSLTAYHWGIGEQVITGTLFAIYGLRFVVSLADEEPPWDVLSTMLGWKRYESVRYLAGLRSDTARAALALQWPTSSSTIVCMRGLG